MGAFPAAQRKKLPAATAVMALFSTSVEQPEDSCRETAEGNAPPKTNPHSCMVELNTE